MSNKLYCYLLHMLVMLYRKSKQKGELVPGIFTDPRDTPCERNLIGNIIPGGTWMPVITI